MSTEFEQIKELLIAYRKKHNLKIVYASINENTISITGYRKDRYKPVVNEIIWWCDIPTDRKE